MTDQHCHTYEVWDTMGRLAYVGIADDFRRRWEQHQRQSWWLGEIEVAHIDVIEYRTRGAARMSEAAMINEQSPVYNTSREEAAYRQYQAACESEEWLGLGVVGFTRYFASDFAEVTS